MTYTNANRIAEMELAGCIALVKDPNNFDVLANNLTMRIALWYKRERAYTVLEAVKAETGTVEINPFEYVINELQYEYRVAAAWGKVDQEKESRLIDRWGRFVAIEKGTDAALDFIGQLKRNREKRER